MSSGPEAVARGLRTAHFAFWSTVTMSGLTVGLFLAVGVFGSDFLRNNTTLGIIYGGLICISALAAVIGMIVGFVGRCRCLATPPEFATARTRIRLAVLLEGCGWLSGVANLAVAVANSLLVLRLPGDVLKTTTALSFLLLVAGRMMFLWYARSLADATGNNSLARLAARSLVLFIAVAVSVVIGGVPIFTVSAINSPGASTAMTFAVGFGAGL